MRSKWLCLGVLGLAACARPLAGSRDGGYGNGDGGTGPRDGGGVLPDEGGSLDGSGGQLDLAGRDLAGVDLVVKDLSSTNDLSASDLSSPPDFKPAADLMPAPDLKVSCPTTVENCFNNVDDNCNTTINDGCPDTISVGAAVPLIAYGGAGGGAGSAMCPAGQVVTGIRFYYDDDAYAMAGVGVACSTPTLVRGASSYSVSMIGGQTLNAQFYGTGWTGYFGEVCDSTQFQVGWQALMDTGQYVYGLGMSCALGVLTLSGTNQLTITFANLNNQFGFDYGGGTQHPQACPASSALVGFNGRYGGYLDQIQPICAPLVVNYK